MLAAWSASREGRTSSVEHLTAWMHAIARSHRLPMHDAEDVVQTTWLRVLEQVHHIREPRALGAWVETTARRESMRVLQKAARTRPVDPEQLQDRVAVAGVEARAEAAELAAARREAAVRVAIEALPDAIAALPGRQRELMDMLSVVPTPSYADVARELEMPIGSIGPTRARSLARLRRDHRLAALACADEVD